ncbi:MAG: ferritin family protein [Candidatus Omnitrophota bacterium]|nr:ferritin family protein [Candidatus Omnitrophota bacterium]
MANIFNPEEILRIAITVETNGKALYGTLEANAREEKIKETWRYLKEQEGVHQKIFQEMLDKGGDFIVAEFNPGEYDAYMRAIASEYVFTQNMVSKKVKEGFVSDMEAVDFGIYVEKESILTYSALRAYILPVKQAVIDKVIDEERKHLVDLTNIKRSLQKKDNDGY